MNYRVVSVFNTLQGEGVRVGTRAVFVRFSGCNLWNGRPSDRSKGTGACAEWCDTDFSHGGTYEIDELLLAMDRLWKQSSSADVRWCVLTGGEPALQVDDAIIDRLHGAGWRVAIETNGTVALPDGIDWICVSPKRGLDLAQFTGDELKVILPCGWTDAELRDLTTQTDFERWLVQPQDPIEPSFVELSHLQGGAIQADVYSANVRRCVEFVMANPGWSLSLQTHKWLRLP